MAVRGLRWPLAMLRGTSLVEIMGDVSRSIQDYSRAPCHVDVCAEASFPCSTRADRSTSIGYVRVDQTPTDVSDASDEGHDSARVGRNRSVRWSRR